MANVVISSCSDYNAIAHMADLNETTNDSYNVFDPIDWQCMRQAIEEAAQSPVQNQREPRVGAVARLSNGDIFAAHRGQKAAGDHAEFTLIHKLLGSIARLEGATIYTTLEPCTVGSRGHGKQPCAEWIAETAARRVVIGLLDPNPAICGRGYWRLLEASKMVDFFPSKLAEEIRELNSAFINLYRIRRALDAGFQEWIQRHKAPECAMLPGFGLGFALELQGAPNPQEGWKPHEVYMTLDNSNPFTIPNAHLQAFERYRHDNHEQKRFFDDGDKFMVATNPVSWDEAPSLHLRLRRTKYSVQHFYRDVIAKFPADRSKLIKDFVANSLQANFPHASSLQLLVVTRDAQILVTERSLKTSTFQGLWSPSLEEDLREDDLFDPNHDVLTAWLTRALREELGIDAAQLAGVDIRLLSVFLECDYPNVSFCGYCSLPLTAAELSKLLNVKRGDVEFKDWDFIPLARSALLREIVRPSRMYHPSGEYRLLMAFIKNYGFPSSADLATSEAG